jgi:uncharacterized protein
VSQSCYSGARGEVPQDYGKAAELFQRACDGKEPMACARLASMYLTGQGLQQDAEQARRLYQRACDTGLARACSAAASLPR